MSRIKVRCGFSVIELVVTIALVAIISAAVIVGIAPAKRISDARDSKARQDVHEVASSVETCLAYTDPTTGAGNLADYCGVSANLTSSLQGGPYIRGGLPPDLVVSFSGSTVCVWETVETSTWKDSSNVGQVELGTESCP